MKVFETYEIINLLRNYENKKYKLVDGVENLKYIGSIATNYKGYLQFYDKKEEYNLDLNYMSDIFLHGKWEEVKESVDFMTALNSKKKIKPKHFKGNFMTVYQLMEVFYGLVESIVIEYINGEWYIED